MRVILEAAVRPEGRLQLGTALSDVSRKMGLTNADIEALGQILEQVRDVERVGTDRFEAPTLHQMIYRYTIR